MGAAEGPEKPVSLFYSYSHKDESLREKLEEQLVALRRLGLITDWNDREILAGDDWRGKIDEQLNAADVILCLVSASFIASDYCWDKEMKKALERHHKGEALVIPVILRPCHWQDTDLARVQALPKDGRPVTQWPDQDLALFDVTQGIRHAIQALRRTCAVPEVAELFLPIANSLHMPAHPHTRVATQMRNAELARGFSGLAVGRTGLAESLSGQKSATCASAGGDVLPLGTAWLWRVSD